MENENVAALHRKYTGVLEIVSKLPVRNPEELSKAYTPGIAEICKLIERDDKAADEYTIKGKTVAVITKGTAVLGLGNIGPKAGLPVVEGKALLYREFAKVNAFPLCLKQTTTEETIRTIKNIADSFCAIHLEDFKAPECFEIEKRLIEELEIPVYHDDQHGTAIAVLAGLINSCKLTHRRLQDLNVVICGAGASGIATAKLLGHAQVSQLTLVDRQGIVTQANAANTAQKEAAKQFNPKHRQGTLKEALKQADVFIGLSSGHLITEADVKEMNPDQIIFALANPVPEIDPALAKKAQAAIVATGSSQYPNQINNVLVFPGLLKGLLQRHDIVAITDDLKIQIAQALAALVEDLDADHILPNVLDSRVVLAVSKTVLAYSM